VNTLSHFRHKKKIAAHPGERGVKSNKQGKSGEDITISVPVGTIVTAIVEGSGERRVIDLKQSGQTVIVASGGRGGRGNARYATPVQQRPTKSTPGTPGETVTAFLELKLLDDIGLVGLPNAGKSTLLTLLTSATPRIGSYPFTTLEPNLGVAHVSGQEIVLADLPGLIEGASTGKGLGDQFLKHIQRTAALYHLVSLDPADGEPWSSYTTIREELARFDPALANKPYVVLLTKVDIVDPSRVREIAEMFSNEKIEALTVNILSEEDRYKILTRALALKTDYAQVDEYEESEPEIPTYTLENLPHKFKT
jgi:GTP-binding protein